MGTPSPYPWDLSLCARMAVWLAERLPPLRAIPAAESALRSHPCVAVSSAQVPQYMPLWNLFRKNDCFNPYRQCINTLVWSRRWPVLKCPSLAGFQMSTEAATIPCRFHFRVSEVTTSGGLLLPWTKILPSKVVRLRKSSTSSGSRSSDISTPCAASVF